MRDLIKRGFSLLLLVLLAPLRLLPVRRDLLVFTGLTGGAAYEYACNPKYICEYLCSRMPSKFKIVWVVSRPAACRARERKEILFLRHYSLRSFYYLMTARVVVTSGSYAPWFPFRKSQYLINTWHGGGAYKKLKDNYDEADPASRRKLEFTAANISLFLSSCQKATDLLIRGAFHYGGEVMEEGTPRNDCLVRKDTRAGADRVRARYGIPEGDRILLYAPTYRTPSQDVVLHCDRLLELLERDGKRWHILVRAHRLQKDAANVRAEGAGLLDAGDDPDMQELLMAADMMITDYSSAIWDYTFLERPCFLYVPDLEEYEKKVGFYVDIRSWPYPMARTMEELEDLIQKEDARVRAEAIRRHHEMMGSFESGHACEAVARRILEICG